MSAMRNFEAEAKAAVASVFHPHHHQENHMTTPQQPTSVVDSLHAITSEIQANPLIARLAERRIGMWLTQQEADSIVTLIAGIEKPRIQAAQHDGTQQQPVQQQ